MRTPVPRNSPMSNPKSRYRRVFAGTSVLLLALILGSASARAEPIAYVQQVLVPDARDRWVDTKTPSAEALRIRGEAQEPITPSMPLEPGDHIHTGQAHVVITHLRENQIRVDENSDLVVQEDGVVMENGGAGYLIHRVRGLFTVRYNTVTAAVEGTSFRVEGPDPVDVAVDQGRVRVQGAMGDPVVLKKGHHLSVSQAGAALPTAVGRLSPVTRHGIFLPAWTAARPSVMVGLLGGGGLAESDVDWASRILVGVHIWRGLGWTVNAGMLGGGTLVQSHWPQSAGLEYSVGPLTLGGQIVANLNLEYREGESAQGDDGLYILLLHLGGAGTARLEYNLSERLFLLADFRGGYLGDVSADSDYDMPLVELTAGLGFGI